MEPLVRPATDQERDIGITYVIYPIPGVVTFSLCVHRGCVDLVGSGILDKDWAIAMGKALLLAAKLM